MTEPSEQTTRHFRDCVSTKQAAKELQIDVLTLQQLMQRDRLPIGYALKKEGKSRHGYYIYRGLLDAEKERLGIV